MEYLMKLPDLGEGVVEAEIIEWVIKPGDRVEEDQPVIEVMTDKATVEITSPVSGTVVTCHGEVGQSIAVGSSLILFEIGGDEEAEKSEGTATGVEEVAELSDGSEENGLPEPTTQLSEAEPNEFIEPQKSIHTDTETLLEKPVASPSVRRRAREAHVDLREVAGTERGGRISHEDLDAFISSGARQQQTIEGAYTLPTEKEEVATSKVTGLRRVIAEKMSLSKRLIPHYSYIEELDITELEAARQRLNIKRKDNQPKLTYLPFLIEALTKTLKEFPQLNAHYDDEGGELHLFKRVHVGIATQTPNGLMVPVIKGACGNDLWSNAAILREVSEAARNGTASRDQLSGSTITITSLGKLGGLATTPVINRPEVAIVGVNKSIERPMIFDGQVVPRLMMNLSCSFDHRIVDGYEGAQFVQTIKALLEDPVMLFV